MDKTKTLLMGEGIYKIPVLLFWILRGALRRTPFSRLFDRITLEMPIKARVRLYGAEFVTRQGSDLWHLAFKPNPKTFLALQQNTRLNSLDDTIVALPYALLDKEGVAILVISDAEDGGASLVITDKEKRGKRFLVETGARDSQLNMGPKSVFIMKVDVEGAEPMVFAGAQRLLCEGNLLIIFEALTQEFLEKRILFTYGYRIPRLSNQIYMATKG